jgi:hypothetical protein
VKAASNGAAITALTNLYRIAISASDRFDIQMLPSWLIIH